MEFNTDQLAAIKAINAFIEPTNKEKYLLLTGSAGTGKTTVICHVFNHPRFNDKKIAFSAPTNKAVSVMKLLSPMKNRPGVSYSTTHRIAGITRKIDENGSIYFGEREDEAFVKTEFDYIIIDEASMISKQLSDSLKFKLFNSPTKIIYVGDKNQLPPVNEAISKIFTSGIKTINLNIIERYKNGIVTYANSIKNNTKIKSSELGTDVIFYKDEIQWVSDFVEDYKNSVILAYTNKKVDLLNNLARSLIFKETNEKYQIGDKIVFNSHYNQNEIVFYTSQIAIIDYVATDHYELKSFPVNDLLNIRIYDESLRKPGKKSYKKVEDYKAGLKLEDPCPICYDDEVDELSETPCGHRFCTMCIKLWLEKNQVCPMCRCSIVQNPNSPETSITINDDPAVSTLVNEFISATNGHLVKINYLSVCPLDIGEDELNISRIIRVIHEDNKKEYIEIITKLREILMKLGQLVLKKSKNKFNCSILINLWNFYYGYYIDTFADISYGYAMTVHKSQGSTYDNVYVHLNNVLLNRTDLKQCVYTGITRASKTLKILK
jgi:hypothetical protein